MSKLISGRLARLQNKSQISASKWREWCTSLILDPVYAIEIWEEICYPIKIATRTMPEQYVFSILWMRSVQPKLNISDFKEAVPKILYSIAFLYKLKDETLTKGNIKKSVLKFYKTSSTDFSVYQGSSSFAQRFIVEFCSLVLIVKVLRRSRITLGGALKALDEGQVSLNQLVELGSKSLGEISYAEIVRSCLEHLDPGLKDSCVQTGVNDAGNDQDAVDKKEDPAAIKEDLAGFLKKFKAALEGIYKGEAVNAEVPRKSAAVLDGRLKSINAFNPQQAVVPDLEEAKAIALRSEAEKNPSPVRKPSINIDIDTISLEADARSSSKGEKVDARSSSKGEKVIEAKPANLPEGNSPDIFKLDFINQGEFSDRVYAIADLLSSIEPADQIVWSIFLNPATPINNLRVFARALKMENTGPYQAYTAIKKIAQLLRLKNMLKFHDSQVVKKRNLTIEVTSFTNSVKKKASRSDGQMFSPDDRQLSPLARILDHTSAALLRLEALRTNYLFGLNYPDEYSEKAVLRYYEDALRQITAMAERTILAQARQLAALDTSSMLELFVAQKFVDQLVETCRAYVQKLQDEGHTRSLKRVKEFVAENVLEFKDAKIPSPLPGAMPAHLLQASELGEVFDAVCEYTLNQAWAVMSPIHEPQTAADRLKDMLRKLLVSSFVLRPEKKRHHENPRLGLAVVGLDKICGDPNFKDLYIRVDEDGKVIYHDDFEDGSYVDLFELREYKPSRVHARAKEQAVQSDAEELQTGSKYLYTVGCTNQFFGKSPSDVINSCIRSEDGSLNVFPVF